MKVEELMNLTLDQINKRMEELDAQVNGLNKEDATDETIEKINQMAAEKRMLINRRKELEAIESRKAMAKDLTDGKAEGAVVESRSMDAPKKSAQEKRADELLATGRMEVRQLLTTGALIPAAVKEEIGELPETMSTIVDDVHSFDLDGKAGVWQFAYRDTDSVAAAVTEGTAIAGTAGTFKKGEIKPETWGILDEISNQVKHFSPLQYETSIRNNAYLALRRYAKHAIAKAILDNAREDDGKLVETKDITIDVNFLRNLVLGFNADESVAGGAKLYLTKASLQKIGAVRGTSEKKALFDIKFTDENNGTIQEGGLSVNFSILSDLDQTAGLTEEEDVMIYGQMQSVDMPLWGNYVIETDEGGDYFKRNMMGIRGLQSAAVGVTRKHTVQVLNAINP